MKFRTKFGLLGWMYIPVAGLHVFVSNFRINPSTRVFGQLVAAACVLLALIRVVGYLLTYWELDADGLRERRYLRTMEVFWHEVTGVHGLGDRASSDTLVVEFDPVLKPSLPFGSNRIVATPEDREQFIATLERFAPQANFEV